MCVCFCVCVGKNLSSGDQQTVDIDVSRHWVNSEEVEVLLKVLWSRLREETVHTLSDKKHMHAHTHAPSECAVASV